MNPETKSTVAPEQPIVLVWKCGGETACWLCVDHDDARKLMNQLMREELYDGVDEIPADADMSEAGIRERWTDVFSEDASYTIVDAKRRPPSV